MSLCRSCTAILQLRIAQLHKCSSISQRPVSFFSRGKSDDEESERPRKVHDGDGFIAKQQLNQLSSKTRTLTAHKPYSPPSNIDSRAEKVVREVAVGKVAADWQDTSLADPRLKFKVLSKLIEEFDHDIPGFTLTDIKTVADAVKYFHIGVKETATLEDLKTSSAIPANLHINTDYLRFNPETDTMFSGRTAFPGQDTYVTSIKYKRKYKPIKTTKPKAGYENHYWGY